MTITEGQRAYRPYGGAEQLMYCRDKAILYHGPIRTGKSLACLTKLYACAEQWPGMAGLILRQTRESLTETGLKTWEDEVVPAGHPILGGAKRNIRQSYHFPNGSQIVVGGLDNATKIMSGQFDMIYILEATEIEEEAYALLTGRNLRFKMPFNQIIMDCNPDAPNHWLKRYMDTGKLTGIQARFEDNPKYWDRALGTWTNPEGLVLKATLDDLPPMIRIRHRDGIWAAAEGAVYDAFDPSRDVVAPFALPDDWPRHVGLDFGAVNTAATLWAEDPDSGVLHLYREYLAGGRTAGQHVHYLTLHEPPFRTVVGGAGAEGQWRLEFQRAGLNVLEPRIRDVALGISRVYGQHKRGGIKVFDTCTAYLAQKSDYRYEPDTLDSTAKIHNQNAYHLLDSERYIIGYLRGERSVGGRGGLDTLPVMTTN